MPSYLTQILLEFSEDDLSDTTPTWVDVSSDCQQIEWWAGVDNEGDDPQPGGAVIRLRNKNRRWEPDYVAGAFYPNIDTGRRFRLTLNDGTGATQEGLWYITQIDIDYPAGTAYSEVTMTCADGFEVLALDDLPVLDPPSADDYASVVAFDEPWGYWRLGEPEGSKLVAHNRISKRKFGKGKNKRRRRTRWVMRETIAELAGVAGPSGSYINNPELGAAGAILGDTDTAVHFAAADRAQMTPEDSDTFGGNNKASAELWAKLSALTTSENLLISPESAGDILFFLAFDQTADHFKFVVFLSPSGVLTVTGATTVTVDVWHHVVGTWDGMTARLYVDGALDGEVGGSGFLPAADAGSPFLLAGQAANPAGGFASLDEVAVYEYVLSAERILAHYTAGSARGWPEQTVGTRIADIATSDLWSEASIQATGLTVQPQMKHGQAKLEEISELMHAEGPRTMFFFNGSGNPVYLGWDWMGTAAAYNTTQATFGPQAGQVGYEGIEPIYDNEVYNTVTASREGGELVSLADSASVSARRTRTNPDFTDLLLSDDEDVTTIGAEVLELYKEPALRPASITVNGSKAVRQILDLDIGHQVRVKGLDASTPFDRITWIIGKRKTLTKDRHLLCTWNLARGFNASLSEWHLGISGYTELNSTAVLG
jgi:hypothetical protein